MIEHVPGVDKMMIVPVNTTSCDSDTDLPKRRRQGCQPVALQTEEPQAHQVSYITRQAVQEVPHHVEHLEITKDTDLQTRSVIKRC